MYRGLTKEGECYKRITIMFLVFEFGEGDVVDRTPVYELRVGSSNKRSRKEPHRTVWLCHRLQLPKENLGVGTNKWGREGGS